MNEHVVALLLYAAFLYAMYRLFEEYLKSQLKISPIIVAAVAEEDKPEETK